MMDTARRIVSTWRVFPPLLVVFAAAMTMGDVRETDVYWHIKMGYDILDNHRLTGDPNWIYGPGDANWVTTQWLAEIFLAQIYQIAGWPGIVLLRMTLSAAVLISIFMVIRRILPRTFSSDKVARVQTIFGLVCLFLLVIAVQERPQSVSLVILPWVGLWTARYLYTGKWPSWWGVGLTVMAWSWFHGGSLIVAPALFTAFIIRQIVIRPDEQWWHDLLKGVPALAAAALAPAISPVGLAYYKQAMAIQQAANGLMAEWNSAPLSSPSSLLWLFLLSLWVVSLIQIIRQRISTSSQIIWAEAIWLTILFLYSTIASRYILVAFLLALPIIARRVGLTFSSKPVRPVLPQSWVILVSIFAIFVLAITTIFGLARVNPSPPDTSPNRIWQGLAEPSSPRRILVDYNLSGKTMMFTSPENRISIDGRSDRYGELLPEYRTLMEGGAGWRETFSRNYASTTDIIVSEQSALIELLVADGWRIVCSDNGYVWLTAPGYTGLCKAN